MVTRAIKRFIDVEIRKDSPGVSAAGFGILLTVTDSPLLSTTSRVKRFTTPDSVGLFFGDSSEEYLAADAFFYQDPFLDNQPEEIQFGRYADTGTAALLECGDSPETDYTVWALISDGSLTVEIDGSDVDLTGLDFSSVTSLDDVASVIDAALSTDGDCYYLGGRFNINSATTGASSTITLLTPEGTGTDISGSAYLDGDTAVGPSNLGGSILSQGAGTSANLSGGTSPVIVIGTWTAVTDGECAITIDGTLEEPTGLNFSGATDMDDVAAVIDAGLTLATCTWSGTVFDFTSLTSGETSSITFLSTVATPVGTDISGSGFTDCDSSGDGTLTSPGTNAEDFDTAITAIENVNNDWYALGALKKYRDTDDAEDMADEIESRRKMFLIASNDVNTLTLGSTSTFSYYLKNADYKRTAAIYHDNSALYPDMSWMGQQLPKDVGSTNWAYQELAGIAEGAEVNITAVTLTEAQKDAALDVNCNLYTSTLAADFTYFGTMGGGRNADKDGEYIDIIRNIDFLQARTEEGLLDFLLQRDIVPMTNAGISMVDNQLKSLLDTYGVKQGILVQDTVVTSFPKRSEISQTDRDDRLLPDGTFTAELQGAINTVDVRGTVYI